MVFAASSLLGGASYALRAYIPLFHTPFPGVEEQIQNVLTHIIRFRQMPWTLYFRTSVGTAEDAPKARSKRPVRLYRQYALR